MTKYLPNIFDSFKKHKIIFLLFTFASFCLPKNIFAQTGNGASGINETFAIVNVNGTTSFYNLFATTANPDFQNANFGTYTCNGTLVLKGGQNKVYKCSGGDILNTELFYRVYKTGAAVLPTFTAVNIGFFSEFSNGCGGKDQTWESGSGSINLLSGLTPGTYTMEVYSRAKNNIGTNTFWYASNNGNNYKATFTVTGPTITGFTSQPFCAGQYGSIIFTTTNATSVTKNGAIATSPITNLTGGTYTLVASDANGCTAQTTLGILPIPDPIVLTATGSNPACATQTGSIAFTANGGTGLLALDFYGTVPTNPITGLTPFTYLLTATDANGCSASTTVTITEPPQVYSNLAAYAAGCNGANGLIAGGYGGGTGVLTATVNGGPFLGSYPAGTYSVIVSDAIGCSVSQVLTIGQPNAISASAVFSPILCNNGTTTVTVAATGGTLPYASGTGTIANVASGTYTYTVTDANGCTGTTFISITNPALFPLSISVNPMPVYLGSSVTITPIGSASYTIAGASYSSNSPIIINNITAADGGVYVVTATNASGCTNTASVGINPTNPPALSVPIKVFLGGAYNAATQMMQDTLRLFNLIPTMQPYNTAPYASSFTQVNNAGTETIGAGVLAVSGANAIVDWVFVEVRSAANNANVLATKSALVQRDGDIVNAADGMSALNFNLPVGSYFISVKHRNHLGVMTSEAIALSSNSALVDFTSTTLGNYSSINPNTSPLTGAQKLIGTKRVLYGGNCKLEPVGIKNTISYGNLPSSDRAALLTATGGSSLPNSYSIFDVDMNGTIRFNGLQTDRIFIQNVCLSNAGLIIKEQLP